MNVKHLILSSLILLTFLSISSCGHNPISSDNKQISGLYTAIKFTMPGDLDGTIDILANGGSLNLWLQDDFKVFGHLLIPANIGFGSLQTDVDLNGNFAQISDTIFFQDTGTFLDSDTWLFLVQDHLLKTPEWTGRRGQNKIILMKL